MYQYFSFVSSDALGTSIIDFFVVRILENQLLKNYDCKGQYFELQIFSLNNLFE